MILGKRNEGVEISVCGLSVKNSPSDVVVEMKFL